MIDRLTHAPLTLRDLVTFNAIRNASCEFLHDPRPFTLPETVMWFRQTAPQFRILLLDDVPIGYFRLSYVDAEAQVGLDLHPDYRGRKLAVPAYRVLSDWLSGVRGVLRCRLRVLKSNPRAKHVYDQLGFQVVGETDIDYEMLMELT